jgi:hypothetical protein
MLSGKSSIDAFYFFHIIAMENDPELKGKIWRTKKNDPANLSM